MKHLKEIAKNILWFFPFLFFTFCTHQNMDSLCEIGSNSFYKTLFAKAMIGDGSPLCGLDYSGPFVQSITPVHNTSTVSPTSMVRLTFSEALNPPTVNSDSIVIKDAYYQARGNYDLGGAHVVFSPSLSSLKGNTPYTVSVNNRVKDIAGNLLQKEFQSTFTTSAGGRFWHSHFGLSGNTQGNALAEISDGGLILGGTSENITSIQGVTALPNLSYPGGVVQGFLIKLKPTGYPEWYGYLGTASGYVNVKSIKSTPDGGFIIMGNMGSALTSLAGKTPILGYSGSGEDQVVVKMSSSGTVEWFTFLGGSGGNEMGGTILVSRNGGYLIALTAYGTFSLGSKTANYPFSGTTDLALIKLKENGQVDWFTFFGYPTVPITYTSLTETSDGTILLGGSANGNVASYAGLNSKYGYFGANDVIIAGYSPSGVNKFYSNYGGSGNEDNLGGIIPAVDGGAYFLTHTNTTFNFAGKNPIYSFAGTSSIALFKIKSDGTYQWHSFFGASGASMSIPVNSNGNGLILASDGGPAFTGLLATGPVSGIGGINPKNPFSASTGDSMVFKIHESGYINWYTFFGSGGGGYTETPEIVQTYDGGYAVLGKQNNSLSILGGKGPINGYGGGTDAIIIRVKSDGGF